jgi:hypothetical protein
MGITNSTITDMEICYKVFNRKVREAITVGEEKKISCKDAVKAIYCAQV